MNEAKDNTAPRNWHFGVLLIAIVCLGFYVQFLNQTLYLKKAPFFDSVRYYDRLFEVVSIRQQEGLVSAFENVTQTKSTFCLPYLLAIPFSYFLEPSRAIGVWIEVFYLAVFVFSFAVFLRKNHHASSWQIVSCMVPIALMNAFYRSTAGLSDLRVDLPVAFLYGAAACWWLMGRRHLKWSYVFCAGFCVGMACLTRATAPIFFGVGFVPIVIFDLWRSRDRIQLSGQFAVVVGIALVMAAWFYMANYKFIFYYYAVWNTDANATVSVSRSLKHLVSVSKSIGVFAGLFFLATFFFTRKNSRSQCAGSVKEKPIEAGKLACLAAAPVTLLILKRTDINPFVSLPSAICLLMVLIVLFLDRISLFASEFKFQFLSTSALLFFLVAGVGFFDHSSNQADSVTPHQKVVQVLETNASSLGRRRVVYSVNLLSSINTASLEGTFQFSPKARYVDSETVEIDDVQYSVVHDLLNPSKANWDKLPGSTIDEKIQLLESRIAAKVDYVIAPTHESVSAIQSQYDYSYSTRFAGQILKQFRDSGNWHPVSKVIDVEPGLKVRVLRNVSMERISQRTVDSIR